MKENLKTTIQSILLAPVAIGLGIVIVLSWFFVPMILMLIWNNVFPQYAISIWAALLLYFIWGIASEAVREWRKRRNRPLPTPGTDN